MFTIDSQTDMEESYEPRSSPDATGWRLDLAGERRW
jgi:hypothetical protein